MEFDRVYRLTSQLKLSDGRVTNLRLLNQQQTYWGLLGGLPNAKTNTQLIEYALKKATEQHCFHGESAHLLAPCRRDFEIEPGDMESLQVSENRTPEWLPRVQCVGKFESLKPASDASKVYSLMTILWFQDDYAMPIAKEIEATIQNLNWNRLATDVDAD
jgi:hypothetical protein